MKKQGVWVYEKKVGMKTFEKKCGNSWVKNWEKNRGDDKNLVTH